MSKNKDIVIVERNSTREAWNAASEKLIPFRKKMSEVLRLYYSASEVDKALFRPVRIMKKLSLIYLS